VYGAEFEKDAKPLINLYRQYDGYVEGHGAKLADFLNGMYVVNGLGLDNENKKISQWHGLFSRLKLILTLKMVLVSFTYTHQRVGMDCWQEYEYHIYSDKVIIKAYEDNIFEGTWQEFIDYVARTSKNSSRGHIMENILNNTLEDYKQLT
jgi:hypothetical protein